MTYFTTMVRYKELSSQSSFMSSYITIQMESKDKTSFIIVTMDIS
jgi:hypothetical protein